ncbi:MAG: SPOR domain-containing protein [Bacteroidales bacterium]|nr:SPOR domain-containing protein [Bacteroidales bacterium]
MMRFFTCSILFTLYFCSFAQTSQDNGTTDLLYKLQEPVNGLGTISINQDTRVQYLLNKHIKINEGSQTIKGWRIQIYNSSGKESKEQAKKVREKFLAKYPDVSAYLIYQPPYFKIRIGDFRTKQEAFYLYKDISSMFPVLYYVSDEINFPAID